MPSILVLEIKEGKNAQKIKKLLTIIFHYLVVEKHLLFVYQFVIFCWFVCINLGKRDFSWGDVISWGA
jgi:hypothetical protein